jgi:hypothetical protein
MDVGGQSVEVVCPCARHRAYADVARIGQRTGHHRGRQKTAVLAPLVGHAVDGPCPVEAVVGPPVHPHIRNDHRIGLGFLGHGEQPRDVPGTRRDDADHPGGARDPAALGEQPRHVVEVEVLQDVFRQYCRDRAVGRRNAEPQVGAMHSRTLAQQVQAVPAVRQRAPGAQCNPGTVGPAQHPACVRVAYQEADIAQHTWDSVGRLRQHGRQAVRRQSPVCFVLPAPARFPAHRPPAVPDAWWPASASEATEGRSQSSGRGR